MRRLRSYLDAWIGIYEKAEKLPQLTPPLSTPDINAPTEEPSASSPPPLQHTIDYIVETLRTLEAPLPLKAVYHLLLTLGWSATSPDMKMALRNIENTLRKYKDVVTLHKGVAWLVKPD